MFTGCLQKIPASCSVHGVGNDNDGKFEFSALPKQGATGSQKPYAS
jgi:hypothetical protein